MSTPIIITMRHLRQMILGFYNIQKQQLLSKELPEAIEELINKGLN
jgi:hypothetical protein